MRAHQRKGSALHAQVVTYRIAEVSDAEFVEGNLEFAEMMATVPGLVAKVWLKKVWLKGDGQGVYGGLYLWQDREDCERFLAGPLWAEVTRDDSVLDLTTHDYAVMEELTRLTQPGLTVQ
jgi:hypothetical protein